MTQPRQPGADGSPLESADSPVGWGRGLAEVLKLSAPIVPAMLAQMLMGFFDTWMVGKIGTGSFALGGWSIPLDTLADAAAGKPALAAIVPAVFAYIALMSVFVGIATATSSFASQALGRDEPAEAGRFAWQSIYLGAASLAVAAAAWAISGFAFGPVAPNATVLAQETAYFDLRVWSLPAAVVVGGISAFFQGVHRPIVPALVGIAANVLNVGLNWCLIYGRCGAPRMGIAGSAAATVIATVVSAGVLLAVLLSRPIAARFATRAGWRPSRRRLGRLLWIGAPSGLSWLLDMIGWSLMIIVVVQPLGETEAAASNTVMNYLQLGFMPVVGVGIAVLALVGRAIGQGAWRSARRYGALGLGVGGVYQLAVGVAMIVFRRELTAFFTDDPAVIRLGGYAFLCAGVFQFFDAMGIIYVHALRGAGDTHFLFAAQVVLIGGLFVPLILLFRYVVMPAWRPDLVSIGPWIAGTIYIIALGAVVWLRWLSGAWRRIDLFGRGGEAPASGPPHAAELGVPPRSPEARG